MKTINTIIIILSTLAGAAQDQVKLAKETGFDDPLEAALLQRQYNSVSFFEFTKRMAFPSTVSTIVSDFQSNSNSALNKKNIILNADIQSPIPLGGKRWYLRTQKCEWYNALHVIPQFQVRIFQNDPRFKDVSQPVRTPSYLPRISYYGTPKKWIQENKIKGVFVSAFHHSNGQDGTEFFTADSMAYFWKKGQVNTYNGNFGEDLVFEGGLVFSRNGKLFDISDTHFHRLGQQIKNLENGKGRGIFSSSDEAIIRLQSRISWEFHPKSLTNQDFDLADIYGRSRINTNFSWSFISFPAVFIKKRPMATTNRFMRF